MIVICLVNFRRIVGLCSVCITWSFDTGKFFFWDLSYLLFLLILVVMASGIVTARRVRLVIFIFDFFKSIHAGPRCSPGCHNFMLREERLGKAKRRGGFELCLFHSLGEDIFYLALSHGVDLGLEVLCQPEGLNLKSFALADKVVNLFDATQSDLFSLLFC